MSRQLSNQPKTDQNQVINRQVGRPLSYRRKHLGIARDYVRNYEEYGDVIPTVAGLACHLEKSRDTIYEWVKADIDPKFSDLIKQISAGQERKLLNNGLKGEFNAAITKLCLVSKHGYSENNQQDSSVTVNVNRDSVEITHKGQTLSVEDEG
jgi:serine protease inhibitor